MRKGRNTVLRPPQQITKLSKEGSGQMIEITEAERWLRSKKQELGRLYYVLILMFRNGLRVSEALEIDASHIDSQGGVIVRLKKKGGTRYILDAEASEFLKKFHGEKGQIFGMYSRQTIHYKLKSAGIYIRIDGNERDSVCHQFRHLYVERLREIAENQAQIAQATGHKNQKNVDEYGRDRPKKRKAKPRNS